MQKIIIMEWTQTWDWQPVPVTCDTWDEAHEVISQAADSKHEEAVSWKWESNAVVKWNHTDVRCAVVHAETGEVWAAWKVITIEVPNING